MAEDPLLAETIPKGRDLIRQANRKVPQGHRRLTADVSDDDYAFWSDLATRNEVPKYRIVQAMVALARQHPTEILDLAIERHLQDGGGRGRS